MSDDVHMEPATTTQSTGDIPVVNTGQGPHPSFSLSPLRKATSDNRQGSAAWFNADERRSPSPGSRSPAGGGASKSADTAVGEAATTTRASGAPARVDPTSVGDHSCAPRRPPSWPTAGRNDFHVDVGRRPASDHPPGCCQILLAPDVAADFAPAKTNDGRSVAGNVVDGISWTASHSHGSSPTSKSK